MLIGLLAVMANTTMRKVKNVKVVLMDTPTTLSTTPAIWLCAMIPLKYTTFPQNHASTAPKTPRRCPITNARNVLPLPSTALRKWNVTPVLHNMSTMTSQRNVTNALMAIISTKPKRHVLVVQTNKSMIMKLSNAILALMPNTTMIKLNPARLSPNVRRECTST